ncbi:LamG-like jellyroll fold domain-containing protein [Lentzea pudingi]|uniref:LamG-like jellyroll fold domain-containing protein n=1 Tax=Lentzea pudingi TaxID=1789439 RepID=UPI001665D097|nr:LamG-like jellyroll fold domain-containing protein [Lentzea pudingi]
MFTSTLIGSVATASAAVPDEVADAAGAEKLARQSGKSIVIGAETTEGSQVKANPDGSRTLISHTQPVRVKNNGSWAGIDLDLAPRADGSLAPKVAPVSMSFNPGGPGSAAVPVARLIKDDAEVGFGWETDLPPARISGEVATYPDVLPGVDLEVKATLTGFSQNLVVKNAEAAKSPKLRKFSFKSHVKNIRIAGPGQIAARSAAPADAADGLAGFGADGTKIFSGDASRMWDSSESGRTAIMGVEVGQDTVSITPDQTFLADPTTVYPVRLDPDYSCTTCSKQHHVVVQSPWGNATNYDVTSGQLGDLKAGYVNAATLGSPSAGVSRTYFDINTSQLANRTIHSATVHATVINSYSCDPTPTELWLTAGIGPWTTWNNQPAPDRSLSANNTRNSPGYCATDGGADFGALEAVKLAAAGSWLSTTFMFKAQNELSLDRSWRRFGLNPYLEVKYNSTPNPPSEHGMEGWGPNKLDALQCVRGAARPALATRTPRLRARVSDPDGGMIGDSGFAVYRGPVEARTWIVEPVALNVPSGSYAQVQVPPAKLPEDGVYSWSVFAGDGDIRSPWSGDCEFTVDTVAPNKPAVASTDYPASGFHGSVGRTGTFTFSPNGNTGPAGSMDVIRYGWSLNVDTVQNQVNVTGSNGVMNVPITPTQGGTNTLFVQAYDKAGNRAAAPQQYVFNVAAPSNPMAAWNFNETGGTTAADITGQGRPLTLTGATFGAGYASNGQVNTASTFSTTTSAPVNTSLAFSVSAWVKLADTADFYTVASQDGDRSSAFFLRYARDVNRWSFNAATADQDHSPLVGATSAAPPEVGVWTHLVGTYEPNGGTMSLYVNGKLDGTATATLWNATGPFVVGAAKWVGGRTNQVRGTIDHVQVWDRQISAAEAAGLNNFAVLRAHYNLDERTGTTTRDEVTGQNATVSGGATWAGTPVDPDDPNQILTSKDKWLNFDSSSTGQVAGGRPANLRTDRSYTVSAWVRSSGFDASGRGAVSLGDATHSPFILGYRPETGKWGFSLTRTPSGDGRDALSDRPAVANVWVHLAATFDATTGTVALYVDGIKQETFNGPSTGQQTFNGSGDLFVGRAIWAGQKSDVWKGDLDDVRVYSGVLTLRDIESIRTSTQHG